ncbi:MAG: TatA/E family twin arginine-targeting protein translocase [Cyanobacteriota bacterium]|nr:TatA/E family twin arginine-targeting protein translocase [Cyanobacteriota bacterium]
MNVFGIGLPEMAVIAVIGLLVFGPKRLPELGKTLGRTLRGFQSASQEFEREFRSAIAVDGEAEQPSAPAGIDSSEAPVLAAESLTSPAATTVTVQSLPTSADAAAESTAEAAAGGGQQA